MAEKDFSAVRRALRVMSSTFVSVATLGCLSSVERTVDTRVWLYDDHGAPIAGAKLVVETVREPRNSEEPPESAWTKEQELITDGHGRAVVQGVRVTGFSLPIPHGSGPRDYWQRLRVKRPGMPEAVIPAGTRAIQAVLTADGRGYVLLFFHNYDHRREKYAFYARCARDVEAFAFARRYMERPNDPDFPARVRKALFDEAGKLGRPAYTVAEWVVITMGEAYATTCSADIMLEDLQGNLVH